MSDKNLSANVNVCEDTDKAFSIYDILVQAGYAPKGSEAIGSIQVRNPDGTFSLAPTSLVRMLDDGSGFVITASNEHNWNGYFETLNLIIGDGSLSVRVGVTVDPVNDAPEGADNSIVVADASGYVLKEADFGFRDLVEGDAFKSVVISSVPSSGQLMLGATVLAAGAEVSIADIRAGQLVYLPPATGGGQFGFGFQVRDDGGTEGCKASDLDGKPNDITFTVQQLGSLGDRVWYDTDSDGVQDDGELGASGVSVRLKGAGADGLHGTADDISRTTTTDGQGAYLFTGLAAGQYQVTFGSKSGYAFTTANVGDDARDSDADVNGVSQLVTLGVGEHNLTIDAGLVVKDTGTARLGDRVWYDTDGDGVQDTNELGVAGLTVTLTGAGADGVFGTGDDVNRTTATNDAGNYLFGNLAAGQYRVAFAGKSGYRFTAANVGDDGADSDANVSTGVSHTVALGIGESNLTVDAGLVATDPMTGKIGDRVWGDYGGGGSYHNGKQDSNEVGNYYSIVDIKVTLHDANTGALLKTTYTDSAGKYLFTGLAAGNYYVQFDKTGVYFYDEYCRKWFDTSSWKWTGKDVGSNDAIDSDTSKPYTSTNVVRTDNFYLAPGATDLTRDAGLTPIVIDLDDDGIQTIARHASDATFDLFGNGGAVKSGWISGKDGFLAVDRDGNGKIDDISELFGGNARGAGFAKLASYDSNGDGVVDAQDADFAKLQIWQDLDGNHQTDAGELMTLAQAGVAALTVAYTEQPYLDAQGNLHLERSSATMSNGSSVDMTDVYFNVDAADALAAGVELPTMGELLGVDNALLDQALGGGMPVREQAAIADLSFDAAGEAQRVIAEAMKQADASLAVIA